MIRPAIGSLFAEDDFPEFGEVDVVGDLAGEYPPPCRDY